MPKLGAQAKHLIQWSGAGIASDQSGPPFVVHKQYPKHGSGDSERSDEKTTAIVEAVNANHQSEQLRQRIEAILRHDSEAENAKPLLLAEQAEAAIRFAASLAAELEATGLWPAGKVVDLATKATLPIAMRRKAERAALPPE